MIEKYMDFKLKILQIVIIISQTISTVILAQIPLLLNDLVEAVTNSAPETRVTELREMMYACSLFQTLQMVAVGLMTAKFSSTVTYRLRSNVMNKVQQMSRKDIEKFSVQSLSVRVTGDVEKIQDFISEALMIGLTLPLSLVIVVPLMYITNSRWSTMLFVFLIVGSAIIFIIIRRIVPYFRKEQILNDNLNKEAIEYLNGIVVVRQFGNEKYHENNFLEKTEDIYENDTRIRVRTQFIIPLMQTLSLLIPSFVYLATFVEIGDYYGAQRVALFTDMVVFVSYQTMLLSSIYIAMSVFGADYPVYSVARGRISEILDYEPQLVGGNIVNEVHDGTIEFKNVSFKYPDSEKIALNDVSFKIDQGSKVAIVGPTGSGKTTVAELLMRAYDVDSGEVLVDGVNVKEYVLDNLYERISYATQTPHLFSTSVKENIKFGPRAQRITDEELKTILDDQQCTDFVSQMLDGINSIITEKGKNLSGGQKQRISIARTIATPAEIYVFDDSFSALDAKTDAKVRQAVEKRLADSTVVTITQKVASIKKMDKIIVMDSGIIVDSGTHEELIERCEYYRSITKIQGDWEAKLG